MKRRLASRIISGQDLCLFCAFQPTPDAAVRQTRPHLAIRSYRSSAVAPSQTSATAAQRHDEDEDDPPMLRQNANLASSFPSQRANAPPPAPAQSQPHVSQGVRNFPNAQRKRSEQQTQSSRSTFRHNFDSLPPRGNFGQTGRPQDNRHDGGDSRQVFGNDKKHQRLDKQPRSFESRGQFRQRSPIDQSTEPNQERFTVRRFVPSQNFEPPVEEKVRPARANASIPDRVQQTVGRSYVPIEKPQRKYGGPEQSSIFRRVTSIDPEGQTSARIKRDTEYAVTQDDPEEGGVVVEGIGTPVAASFEATDDIDGFHHRRGGRADKRKPRSARFEDEEEEEGGGMELSTAPMSAQSTSGQRARTGLRPTNFDYEMAEAEEALYGRGRRNKKGKSHKTQGVVPSRPSIRIPEFMSVGQLANALDVQSDSFIRKLEEEGYEGARYDHVLDAQTSSMFADLYGFEPVVAAERLAMDLIARPPPEDMSVLPPRPPIVTIMGHVDHGKTTILDYLRKSSVVATEHGGITQHIGAFSVTMPGTHRQITFLDTPGHAAFLEMRRRGANVTDIVVLVVAADDSVKPQTIEAIKHAMDAKVQIIVAINKVDKEDANIERVKQDLTRHEIVVEDYGGDFQAIEVSGKTGQGMAELEEAIITLADVYDYRAEQDGLAEGTIIESKVTAAGRVATVLVRRGTLRPGDFVVAGTTWARVRTLRDDTGALVTEAPPGTPVQVDGWRGEDPTAGLEVLQAEGEEQAKDAIDLRIEQRESMRASLDMTAINEARSGEAEARAKVLEWESQQEWANRKHGRRPKDNAGWVEAGAESGAKQVHFVIKADVAGSVEAVVAAVAAVGNNEIVANVIHSGIGQVAESDIRMLATTGETGYAISFNQPIDGSMYRLAEAAGLQILDHNIIYKVTDAVKEKLGEQLPPLITQRVVGEAEVGQIFEVTIKKNKMKIAGCRVTNGTVSRANKIRVSRDGSVIYTGTLHSLKNVKKDVTEMRKGTECGMGFENWDDFREGDQIQCFEEHEEKRTLY